MEYAVLSGSRAKDELSRPKRLPQIKDKFASFMSFTKALAPKLLDIKVRICTVAFITAR